MQNSIKSLKLNDLVKSSWKSFFYITTSWWFSSFSWENFLVTESSLKCWKRENEKKIFYEFFVILDIHLWIQIRLGFGRKSEKINQIIFQRPTTAFDPKREGI